MTDTSVKVCLRCGAEKQLVDFRKDIKCLDGVRTQCKTCDLIVRNVWRGKNKAYLCCAAKKWKRENQKKVKQTLKKCWENHGDKYRETARMYCARRRKLPKLNIEARMSSAIRKSIRHNKAGRAWESLVGYSVWDLQVHLQSKFTVGMTWERFLKGEIHIDHIMPKSRFRYETPDDPEFKVCWGLNNLQPLWAAENILKRAKTSEEWASTKAQ